MKDNGRRAGIVLPVFSLPSPQGIGTMGRGAFAFVDFLALAGQSYWQVLPLSPTGFGDSPYQSCCSRAGNPYFIDLELLEADGLLLEEDYRFADYGQHPDLVDYGAIYRVRMGILRKAWQRGASALSKELDAFRAENADWLADYALFMAVKAYFNMLPLKEWPDKGILRREKVSLETYRTLLAKEIEFYEFVQMLFFRQWESLKAYANGKGIGIIGDIPIYSAEDGVEVWAAPSLFVLDEDLVPVRVAGVPPDLYSSDGQLWGNPLYNWPVHKKDGFAWWIGRLRHAARLFDAIRIDHFRAYYNYWSVPRGAPDASAESGGRWEPGPGMEFIDTLRKELPDVTLFAEDLGDLDESVIKFIRETRMPGMSVALYGFDPCGDSVYMSHNVGRETVAYTSTHDSPTFVNWFHNEATDDEREFAREYMRLNVNEGVGWGAVKSVWGTHAWLSMAMLQDVLGLGADSRINTPSTLGGRNWRWRIRQEALNAHVAGMLRRVTDVYRRLPPVPEAQDEDVKADGEGAISEV
ncbi:MAG: 4-alpha-glucanotransferase [Oscillospiraceae bacterium]|jgi:4-alpha-glucanotransferase|nr:4-alpha-glucanotransferase [Oscillospiraceae bacterium]